MTTQNTLTEKLRKIIKEDMIHGYRNENGEKIYPKLTEAAEWYKVSYESLKQYAKDWKWRQKRKDYQAKVLRKIAEKKKSEELSETEAEAIVVDDIKFNRTANSLRRAVDNELKNLEENKVKGNISYFLMNLGRALESAQKVSKTAVGEPSEIIKTDNQVKMDPAEEVEKLKQELEKEIKEQETESFKTESTSNAVDKNEDQL